MIDQYARTIDYMRISITDRCNLRCTYCMPEGIRLSEQGQILSYEEILRLCSLASSLGIKHIKITGGEPLVRKDAVSLLANIKALPGIEHVTLTTNGVLLGDYVEELAKIPIDGVNVSLDSLQPEKFKEITGRDEFSKVWNALQKLMNTGITTKINCVVQRGVNENELMDMVELAVTMPLMVRFIEMMPIGYGKEFEPIQGEEIKNQILSKYPEVTSSNSVKGFGPANYISGKDWKGSVGFINPMSHKFCSTCNRIRVTSKGFLKPCLCYGDGVDLLTLMRSGASDEEVRSSILRAMDSKPLEHNFDHLEQSNMDDREMYKIGG